MAGVHPSPKKASPWHQCCQCDRIIVMCLMVNGGIQETPRFRWPLIMATSPMGITPNKYKWHKIAVILWVTVDRKDIV